MKNDTSNKKQFKCLCIFLVITSPLMACAAILQKSAVVYFACNFLTGLLSWTYLEYHLHRFWTHNKKVDDTSLAYKRHVHHHKHPTEIKVTATQRLVLFSISALLFALSVYLNNYFTIAAGLIIGFAYSFFSHWLLHQAWSRKFFPVLHRFHIHHHCKYPDRCFGFSTVFWDVIFKTAPPFHATISEKIISFYYGTGSHRSGKV